MTLSLKTVGKRFEITLSVIDRGSGRIAGVMTETDQSQVPSYIFVPPRHVFRTAFPTALKPGMVVQTPAGMRYLVGENGPSEQTEGTLWMSFRLYQITGRYSWVRRTTTIDPITKTPRAGAPTALGNIWAVIEPTDREEPDRKMQLSMEKARFLSGHPVEADDLLGPYRVLRSDHVLGVYIGFLGSQ